jgi:hypothetical protein
MTRPRPPMKPGSCSAAGSLLRLHGRISARRRRVAGSEALRLSSSPPVLLPAATAGAGGAHREGVRGSRSAAARAVGRGDLRRAVHQRHHREGHVARIQQNSASAPGCTRSSGPTRTAWSLPARPAAPTGAAGSPAAAVSSKPRVRDAQPSESGWTGHPRCTSRKLVSAASFCIHILNGYQRLEQSDLRYRTYACDRPRLSRRQASQNSGTYATN